MLQLKRITWKSAPTNKDILDICLRTAFGPSVFQKGLEWVFIQGEKPWLHADTPDGYELING